jgi:uncharacterized damage-inducible protein DinB
MSESPSAPFLTPEALLEQWQGSRRLTRKTIALFPEDQLFTFRIGGMRTFGEMALELLAMGVPMIRGIATGEWDEYAPPESMPKDELLAAWDAGTEELNELWRSIDPERFPQPETAFGQYTAPVHELVNYVLENECHHRGQGYVYLRALAIEPPQFWDRG